LRDRTIFFSAFLIVLALTSGLVLLSQIHSPQDDYFALYTLGESGKAEQYFPNDVPNILPGTQIHWFAGVYNHMGSVQLVRVEFKLLNMTMKGPDEYTNESSPYDPFFDTTRLLLSNETWLFPISWSVLNATLKTRVVTIYSIIFNNQTLTSNVQVSSLGGYNFRIVIELWIYNSSTDSFNFGWSSNGVQKIAWNQIWFNMTQVSLIPS
jgi:hypothetical protein